MNWVRRPRRKRLEWQVEMARRRGMWKAVAEIAENEDELRRYAQTLAVKAERLAEAKQQLLAAGSHQSAVRG